MALTISSFPGSLPSIQEVSVLLNFPVFSPANLLYTDLIDQPKKLEGKKGKLFCHHKSHPVPGTLQVLRGCVGYSGLVGP